MVGWDDITCFPILGVNDLILPRSVARTLETMLQVMPAVVVAGARQTGKSTLALALGHAGGALEPPREGASERRYLSLDDLDVLDLARKDPGALVRRARPATLDEVQRAPHLLGAVKREIDRKRRPGRFLLTGSANLLLMRRVSESLAGRASYLTLWPMTRREQSGAGRAGAWGLLLEAPDRDWPDVVRSEYGRAARSGLLLHGGDALQWLTPDVLAAPWWMVI